MPGEKVILDGGYRRIQTAVGFVQWGVVTLVAFVVHRKSALTISPQDGEVLT